MDKKLIGEIKVDGFKETVQVYFVNNKYYSVEYKDKEEYYTTKKEVALPVGKIILTYFKYLNQAIGIFNQKKSDENKWMDFLQFLREESKASKIDWEICLGVYHSLEATYNDSTDKEIKDRTILSRRAAIRNKDNLINTINKIVLPINEKGAERNIEIYRKLRDRKSTRLNSSH